MRTRRPGPRLGAAVLAVAMTMLAACGGGETAGGGGDGSRADGGTLVIAFPNNEQADAKSLDPNVGGGTTYVNSIYGAMFDQLVYQNPKDGEIVPGLAERWEVSPDGLKYTFHLKTGPKFWDGTPVTAEDVKFSLDRTVDKRYLPGNAYVSALMANYSRGTVIDPQTIEVQLKRPQTNFLPSVVGRTYVAIVSKAAAEKAGVPGFGEKPMGSGAFKFVEWVRGDHITVERNPDYTWGPSFFQTAGKPPSVQKIVFRFIAEDSTRLAALESGQANAIQGVPPFDQDRFEKSNQHQLMTVRKNGQAAGLNLNTQRAPTDDLAVRQAVAHALNRDAINRTVYAGKHFPARFILEERMGEWVNKEAAFPEHDLERAKQILDQAGWTAGGDGIRQKAGRRLTLTAICAPDLQQTLTLVQSQLKEAGIQLEVQSMSAAQVSSVAQSSGEFNLAWVNRAGWTNEDPYLLYSLFDSKNAPPNGTSNYSRVQVPEFDQLLETAAVTADPAKRKELYYQAQQKLVDYVPFVPVLSFNQNIVVVKGVNGLLSDMRGTYTYFQDVWLGQSLHSRWK